MHFILPDDHMAFHQLIREPCTMVSLLWMSKYEWNWSLFLPAQSHTVWLNHYYLATHSEASNLWKRKHKLNQITLCYITPTRNILAMININSDMTHFFLPYIFVHIPTFFGAH